MLSQANWPNEWAENGTRADITFLELFPVVVAISIWGLHLRNKKLTFNIDNKSVDKSSTESPSGGYNLTREIQQTD
jgi:hypothetical protein